MAVAAVVVMVVVVVVVVVGWSPLLLPFTFAAFLRSGIRPRGLAPDNFYL